MVEKRCGKSSILKKFLGLNQESGFNISPSEARELEKVLGDIVRTRISAGDTPVFLSVDSKTGDLIINPIFTDDELAKIKSDLQQR